jgi:hypothetical protein
MKTIDDIAQEHVGQEISIVGNGPTLVMMGKHNEYFGRYVQYVRDQKNGIQRDINEYPPPLTHVNRLTGHPRLHWTVNGGWSYHPESNLGFVLDDHAFHRPETHPQPEFYDGLLSGAEIPVITSRVYPAYPAMIEYPLKEVVKKFKTKRFDETIHWEMALAGYFEVKKIYLIGCDYQPFDRFASERSGTEYWIGRLESLNIEIDTTGSQYLMKPSVREPMYDPMWYGFAVDNPLCHDPELLELVKDIKY